METIIIIGFIALICLPGLALAVGGLGLLLRAFEKMFGNKQ